MCKNKKKAAGLFAAFLLALQIAGCQSEQVGQTACGEYHTYEGYLIVDEDKLLVNDFEFIDLADSYWINTLGLTDEDMPNGYYIYDTSDEMLTFALSEQTRYYFYDTGTLFVSEDSEDRLYTTTKLDEFLKKFDTNGDGNLGKTPFEIQVLADGQVLSISEIFVN